MKKLSVQVSDEFYDKVNETAHDKRISKSELIRIALEKIIKEWENGDNLQNYK